MRTLAIVEFRNRLHSWLLDQVRSGGDLDGLGFKTVQKAENFTVPTNAAEVALLCPSIVIGFAGWELDEEWLTSYPANILLGGANLELTILKQVDQTDPGSVLELAQSVANLFTQGSIESDTFLRPPATLWRPSDRSATNCEISACYPSKILPSHDYQLKDKLLLESIVITLSVTGDSAN